MCGNFGLLLLSGGQEGASSASPTPSLSGGEQAVDGSVHACQLRTASTHGLRIAEGSVKAAVAPLLNVAAILELQASNTELRGGQAGGLSSLSYPMAGPPVNARVRCVARKRHPLSRDLGDMFRSQVKVSQSDSVSVIGHTRFATSSINTVPELHPHQWSSFVHDEVWKFSKRTQRMEKSLELCGLHLSHNGDNDALSMYDETLTVNDLGLWLEKVLHVPNLLRGDSPKLAGTMELFHVQGRWNRAARLAWVRAVLTSSSDVCKGRLTREAESLVPTLEFFSLWSAFLESIWVTHTNNIIRPTMLSSSGSSYTVDIKSERQMVRDMAKQLQVGDKALEHRRRELKCDGWDEVTLLSFLTFAVRGFLRGDLYTALTELMSRSAGSFGVQVHSPTEPGVVVIASKGQPMSFAFDERMPIVLFGSEAAALTISVTESGQWLGSRVDLDSRGEIVRIGWPRDLGEGTFSEFRSTAVGSIKIGGARKLSSGIEIRAYSLSRAAECTGDLFARAVPVVSVPIPLVEGIDLVASDIEAIPSVVEVIDKSWEDKNIATSNDARTAQAFCCALLDSIARHSSGFGPMHDALDLIITGVEVSLWMAEQFAADLRMIFPQIKVAVVSSNRLLGLGHLSPERMFFPGSSMSLEYQIDRQHTVCLLVSQSGQTFPTLHAAYSLAAFVESDKLWLLTGTFNSKIENVIVGECFKKRGVVYQNDRVFFNYSGHRPAEPSSVAAVATWHTLSHILLFLAETVRDRNNALAGRDSYGDVKIDDDDFDGDKNDDAVVMLLSDGCIGDLRSLLLENTVKNLRSITQRGGETYKDLVAQGKLWGAHIAEPWNIIVAVGLYITLSVGLGLPIFGLLGDAIVAIIRAAGGLQDQDPSYHLTFNLRHPRLHLNQPAGWTVIGAILQLIDALWFVFLAKFFTWGDRWWQHRALSARMGKRTIVIVDQPAVHQMLENFVSKLYAQAYSFNTPEVHGSCGQDEFVHRFTHRVVRGLLLAVGRPDGRLGCLAKSENAVILATKQAAFIRNPAYNHAGSAPEIVTLSHNPFVPAVPGNHITIKTQRRKFLEEILFEKLHRDENPFTAGILRAMAIEFNDAPPESNLTDISGAGEDVDPLNTTNRPKRRAAPQQHPKKETSTAASPTRVFEHQAVDRPLGSHFIGTDIGSSLHGKSRHGAGGLGASVHGQALGSSVHNLNASTHGIGVGLGVSTHGRGLGASMHGHVHSASTHGRGLGASLHGQGLGSSMHGLGNGYRRSRSSAGDLFLLSQPPAAPGAAKKDSPKIPVPPKQSQEVLQPKSSAVAAAQKPNIVSTAASGDSSDDFAIGFFFNARETRKARQHMTPDFQQSLVTGTDAVISNDPHERLIFSLKTDTTTREIQDQEIIIQSFYEDRVAALERFCSFAVMFHAMAQSSSRPLLQMPWDVSRSQSYLRVATTASPVGAIEGGGKHQSASTLKVMRLMLRKLKNVEARF